MRCGTPNACAIPAYVAGFRLECQAMRRVREDMGFDNVVVMLPFVRRVREADEVLAKMAEFGLARGNNGLQVYAMCEIPNNVLSIDEFAMRFDGFSIGSTTATVRSSLSTTTSGTRASNG